MPDRTFRFPKLFLSGCLRFILSVAICFASLPAMGQDQTKKNIDDGDVIRVTSNLVNLDVTVKDKKGKIIRDLKAEDFTVIENGIKQKIEFFDATLVENSSTETVRAAQDSTSSTPPSGPFPRNIVALVLDGQTTETTNLKPVREGMIHYIKNNLTNEDSVALFAVAGGLQLLQPFTQNREKLIAAVENSTGIATGSKTAEQRDINSTIADLRGQLAGAPGGPIATQAGGSAMAQIMITRRVLEQYVQLRSALSVQQTRPILAALAAIAEGLRPMPGRKTLVMFSQGFVAPQVLDWQVQSTIDIANRANVSIYVIDSTGLKGGTPQSHSVAPPSALSGISAATDQESRIRAGAGESVFDIARLEGLNRQQDLLYRISEDTGGRFIKNTNDIAGGLQRIDDEIRSRYTLAYRSTDQNFDGRFRKIKIEVQRPDVSVVTRSGYYAIPPTQVIPFSPEERKLLASFSRFLAQSTLPISVELDPFRSHQGSYIVPLSFEIPPASVSFDERSGKPRLQLDVLGVVKREGEDAVHSRLGGSFNVEMSRAQYESIVNDKIFYRQDMELEPGNYTVDLLVKDRLSGKVAARREKLVLPVVDSEFSVTNAVLSRHATGYTPSLSGPVDILSAGNVQIRPSPSRQFRATENLILFFRIYNPSPLPDSRAPLVRVTVSLMRDGKLAAKPFEFELRETVDDALPQQTFAKYIKLTGLAPGKYVAVIESKDMARQKTVTQNSPFEIIP